MWNQNQMEWKSATYCTYSFMGEESSLDPSHIHAWDTIKQQNFGGT